MKRLNKKSEQSKGPGVNARFSEPPSNAMMEYYRVKAGEAKHRFNPELWNHKAHTIMLYEQGLVTRAQAARILKCLAEIEAMGIDRFPLDPRKGELFYNIESYLIDKTGEDAGGRLHTGRSRGDMNISTERMIEREMLLQLIDEILQLIETLLELSARNVETIMPGYTMLQHAQPTTLAHYLLSFVDKFERGIERLKETYQRVNRSPMGAAMITGSGFPLNRPRMAELLGFNGVIENTRDASISRDFTLETAVHTMMVLSDLSAFSDDLNLWCTYEFGMVELSDAYCSTSTIMPQKKNPSAMERVRSLSAECLGNTLAVFAQLKTQSEQLGDLSDTAHVAREIFDKAQIALSTMKGMLSTLKVKKEVMAQMAGANFSQATELAETIVKEKGLSFRTAHHIVGKLIKKCMDQGRSPSEITPELLNDCSIEVTGQPLKMGAERIAMAMDVRSIVEKRRIMGGPGRGEVTRMLKKRSLHVAKERDWLSKQRRMIKSASEFIDSLARKIIENPGKREIGRNAQNS